MHVPPRHLIEQRDQDPFDAPIDVRTYVACGTTCTATQHALTPKAATNVDLRQLPCCLIKLAFDPYLCSRGQCESSLYLGHLSPIRLGHWRSRVARDQLADTTSSGRNATRSAGKYPARTNLCGIHRFSVQGVRGCFATDVDSRPFESHSALRDNGKIAPLCVRANGGSGGEGHEHGRPNLLRAQVRP
jgi:hypothetical protein